MSPSTKRLNPLADPPRSLRAGRKHERGFTIIEALIAVTILSAALGIIFGVNTNVMLAAQLTGDRTRARLRLESLLAEIAAGPVAPGETAGIFDDRFSWGVNVAPYPAQVGAAPVEVSAVSVTASVAWRSRGAERALSLTTVRLQVAPP